MGRSQSCNAPHFEWHARRVADALGNSLTIAILLGMGQGLVRHFKQVGISDCERLVEWLPKQSYPYHSLARVDIAWVRDRIADGCFFGGSG